ncbi:carbohydrate esterase family 9 protein [Diplodia corticola]|uniref:Carbohydrate esterase family 9 protein n=1 Tax=Diplodia corticola TaxID=236234 RepID=A0A1J9SL51_9PEZI|nr:carbohydrate esterase family 9 protein [Diplodia corticola]OJD40452.1 carbohydrate esterase family 9 protein [Diplodia corticola]
MEKDGLPTYDAAIQPAPHSRRRLRKRGCLKLVAVACLLYLVYSQWHQRRHPPHPRTTLSLERLHEDLATCAKLQHKPTDPSGQRARNGRYIDGHKPTLIKNATVWTGEPAPGTSDEDARAGKGYSWVQSDVFLEHGLIKSVAAQIPEAGLPSDVLVYDAQGRPLTAGIIDMHSHAGVNPLPQLRGNEDTNEMSADITPYVRSIDGLDPLDHQIQVIKSGGVTTSLVLPGSGNNIGGEAFVVKHAVGKPDGREEVSAADMLADPDRTWRYIKMACGENPKRVYGKVGEHGPTSRMGESWEFRHAFEQAANLVRVQDDWCAAAQVHGVDAVDTYLPQDLRWETLGAVLRGQVHVNAHCYTVPDLEAFIDHTNEFKFPIRAFHHAHETYIVPEILKRAWGGRAPAAALFANNMDYKSEAYRGSELAGKILYENGITPVYVSDNPVLNAQHVVWEATKAYGYGLRYHAALAGVTSAPAELLGLGERIGKVKAGFDADVVVWDSDPLSLGAAPAQIWIDGTAQYEHPYLLNKTHVDPPKPNHEFTMTTEEEDIESGNVVFTGVSEILMPGFEHAALSEDAANNVVIVTNGEITCVGSCHEELQAASSQKTKTVSLTNGHLTPPFTLLGSDLGLSEIAAERDTQDGNNSPDTYFSRAVDGLALNTKQLAAARRHGVTRAITAPLSSTGGSRGVSVGFRTGGTTPASAIWADEASVHYSLQPGAKNGKTPSISAAIGSLRANLLEAVASLNDTTTKTTSSGAADRYSEASYLRRVVAGDLALAIHVDSADTIAALLRAKAEVEDALLATTTTTSSSSSPPAIRLVLIGAAESHLLADELAASPATGVVLAPLLQYSQGWDQRRSLTGAPLTDGTAVDVLLDAGVKVAIGVAEGWEVRDLAHMAGWAWVNGGGRIGKREAVGLVSWNVGEVLGLDGEGKGEWVVWEGWPLGVGGRVRGVGSGSGAVTVFS